MPRDATHDARELTHQALEILRAPAGSLADLRRAGDLLHDAACRLDAVQDAFDLDDDIEDDGSDLDDELLGAPL